VRRLAHSGRYDCRTRPAITTASCTQEELFFASYFNRRWFIYIANDGCPPDGVPKNDKRPERRRDFIVNIVREQGLDRSYFCNMDPLCRFAARC
jgi:hypothetical protein